jgi:uncharacterized protein (TIGR00251 family)
MALPDRRQALSLGGQCSNLGREAQVFLRMNDASRRSWLRVLGEECVLDIAAQPGARASELVGLHDGALRIRIAAPALDGRGNAALCAWLCAQLDLPKRDAWVVRGDKSRRKQVGVRLPATRLVPLIDALLQAAQGGRIE